VSGYFRLAVRMPVNVKQFFHRYSKQYFQCNGKEFFSNAGKQNFLLMVRSFFQVNSSGMFLTDRILLLRKTFGVVHILSSNAVVRTGSPIISAQSVISLLVVKTMDEVSYVSLISVKNLLAWLRDMGVYPISSIIIMLGLFDVFDPGIRRYARFQQCPVFYEVYHLLKADSISGVDCLQPESDSYHGLAKARRPGKNDIATGIKPM